MEKDPYKPKSYEPTLILFSKIWCGLMSLMYIFAQGFTGVDSHMATFVSFCGFFAILPYKNKLEENNISNLILILCILGVLGITFENAEYHINNYTSGGNVALMLDLLFISAFVTIAYYRNYNKNA